MYTSNEDWVIYLQDVSHFVLHGHFVCPLHCLTPCINSLSCTLSCILIVIYIFSCCLSKDFYVGCIPWFIRDDEMQPDASRIQMPYKKKISEQLHFSNVVGLYTTQHLVYMSQCHLFLDYSALNHNHLYVCDMTALRYGRSWLYIEKPKIKLMSRYTFRIWKCCLYIRDKLNKTV